MPVSAGTALVKKVHLMDCWNNQENYTLLHVVAYQPQHDTSSDTMLFLYKKKSNKGCTALQEELGTQIIILPLSTVTAGQCCYLPVSMVTGVSWGKTMQSSSLVWRPHQ